MSIFARPPSPPPRQPSPELFYTPLPSPHVRARQRTLSSNKSSSSSSSSYAPAAPPGLSVKRPLVTARSYDHIPRDKHSRDSVITRTRSNLTVTPPATPRSLPLSSPSRSHFGDVLPHRRTLSHAIPYLSPPPSPTLASPPPPVPPIPAFILSPPSTIKHPPRTPVAITPIHLPELDSLPPLGEATNTAHKQRILSKQSPAEITQSMGMTCLRFFSLRNSKRRPAA